MKLHRKNSVLKKSLKKVTGSPLTDEQFTEFFVELAIDAFDRLDVEMEERDMPLSKNLKWRYASALQKAVRRSDDTAMMSAACLLEIDADYLFRRMPVIALEDIAMSDPYLVGLVLTLCRFKRVRLQLGVRRTALLLSELMRRAVKSRITCDLICLPVFHPMAGKMRPTMRAMQPEDLMEIYFSEQEAMLPRMLAGQGLAGTRWGAEWKSPWNTDLLWEVQSVMAPPLISWTARRYASGNRDGMWIGYPLEYQMIADSEYFEQDPKWLPDRRLLHGVLDASYDGHNREGRSALAYFTKACDPIREWFAEHPAIDKNKTMGMVLFNADSALLSHTYSYDGEEDVSLGNVEAEYLAKGITGEDYKFLCSALAQNRDLLYKARERVTSD